MSAVQSNQKNIEKAILNDKKLITQTKRISREVGIDEDYNNLAQNMLELPNKTITTEESQETGILDYDFLKPKKKTKKKPTIKQQTIQNIQNIRDKLITQMTKPPLIPEMSAADKITTDKIKKDYKALKQQFKNDQDLSKIIKHIDPPKNKEKGKSSSKAILKSKAGNEESSSLYNRIMGQERKKELLLSVIRNQKEIEELKTMQEKPKISVNSQRIVKDQFGGIQPLHTRVADIISKKNYKMTQLKKQIRNTTDNSFIAQNSATNRNTTRNNNTTDHNLTNYVNNVNISNEHQRTNSCHTKCNTKQCFEDWYRMNGRWTMERDFQKHEMKKKIIDNLKEHTFQPEISFKSKEIMAQKYEEEINDNYLEEPFYDRLMKKKIEKENNLESLTEIYKCKFQPEITKYLPDYVKENKSKKERVACAVISGKKKYVSPKHKKNVSGRMNKSQEIQNDITQKYSNTVFKKVKKRKWEDIIDNINNNKQVKTIEDPKSFKLKSQKRRNSLGVYQVDVNNTSKAEFEKINTIVLIK